MERKWELNSRFSSVGYTNLLARWNQLFEFMVVKYNDMIIKPTDKNGTFKKTPSGGRSQLSSGSPRYSKITATCRGEKYWQPTRYPCFFNSSHKGMQRLIMHDWVTAICRACRKPVPASMPRSFSLCWLHSIS